jgi:hypothetical protein
MQQQTQDHYYLRFPTTWWNLDLDPSTRDATIKRRILADVDERTVGRTAVDSMIREARRAARQAHALGALQLAGMFDFTDDGGTLMATTAVHRLITPPDTDVDLPELMVAYAVRNARLPLSKSSPGTADIVDLPYAGSAGRVTYVEDVELYGKGWSRMAVMVTVVKVPGGDDLLVIASTTPNLRLVEAFYQVFGAIAATLRFDPLPEGV